MSATTSIEWTERTWNPVRGCSIVSPGCVHCYAMKQAHRFSGAGKPYEGLTKLSGRSGPQWTGEVRTVEDALLEPLTWRRPARVFVNSMSDLFHEGVPTAFIDRVFAVMALSARHTFQVLTKRPDRMLRYFTTSDCAHPGATRDDDVAMAAFTMIKDDERFSDGDALLSGRWPLPNVWLGVSCENQQTADERIPLLLQTPAAVRFVSAEPLLGPVDLVNGDANRSVRDWLRSGEREVSQTRSVWITGLDWVIVGGESGPGARPCDVHWVREVVRQCRHADVPVFVKQLGSAPLDWDRLEPTGRFRTDPDTGRRQLEVRGPKWLRDRKGGDPAEWPEDLRVREFPGERRS